MTDAHHDAHEPTPIPGPLDKLLTLYRRLLLNGPNTASIRITPTFKSEDEGYHVRLEVMIGDQPIADTEAPTAEAAARLMLDRLYESGQPSDESRTMPLFVEAQQGDGLHTYAGRLVAVAPSVGQFDGILLRVMPGMTVGDVTTQFHDARQRA